MPRPQKSVEDKRTETIRVRVTSTEKKTLTKTAEEDGYTLSDFLRVKAINAVPRTRKASPERAAFIRALADLSKLGNNLNQIARALNRRQDSAQLEGISVNSVHHVLDSIDAISKHILNIAEHGT